VVALSPELKIKAALLILEQAIKVIEASIEESLGTNLKFKSRKAEEKF